MDSGRVLEHYGNPVSAPKDAIVIFDGKETDELVNKARPVKDGVMTVAVGKGYQKTKRVFGAIRLPGEPKSLMNEQSVPRLASAFLGGERR
jgi:hypothetical protein